MNDLVLSVAVVLFPGLIAAILTDNLIVHKKPWSNFKLGLYSFVFGVSCYTVLQLIAWVGVFNPFNLTFLPKLAGQLDIWNFGTNSHSSIEIEEVIAASALAIPIAAFFSRIVNTKLFTYLAKLAANSDKYGDENLFSYYLTSDEISWVYVKDREANLTYEGYIDAFSENETIQEVVLKDVTVYGYTFSEELYTAPSIYLCKPLGVLIIEQILQTSNGESNDTETQPPSRD